MPYREPAGRRRPLRPWPAGHITKAVVATLAAWGVGTLAAIYIGPLVAQLAQLAQLEGAEAIGGVKVIVGVVGWRALPFLTDMAPKVARSQEGTVQ